MPNTGGWTGWPPSIATFCAWPPRSSVTIRRLRKPSLSMKLLRSHGASAVKSPHNLSTASWIVLRRNWKKAAAAKAIMEQLEAIRVQKLEQIKQLGYDPYPTYYRYTHTLAQLVDEFSAKSAEELEHSTTPVRVAGRILTNRPFGKAGFMTLSDGEGEIQVYAKKDELPERDF